MSPYILIHNPICNPSSNPFHKSIRMPASQVMHQRHAALLLETRRWESHRNSTTERIWGGYPTEKKRFCFFLLSLKHRVWTYQFSCQLCCCHLDMGFPVNAPVKHHDTNCRCRKCSSWCPEVCFNHGISLQTHPMIHMPDRRCVFGLPISRQFFIIFGGSSLSCLSIYLHRPCVDRVPRWSVIIHIYIYMYIYIYVPTIYIYGIYIYMIILHWSKDSMSETPRRQARLSVRARQGSCS